MKRVCSLPLLLLLAACPAYEGPIDVVLVDLDDTALVSWAMNGDTNFEECINGTTNMAATVGCGEYGVGDPGTYTIRVEWSGVTVDKDVTIESDRNYRANAEVVFEASEFVTR